MAHFIPPGKHEFAVAMPNENWDEPDYFVHKLII